MLRTLPGEITWCVVRFGGNRAVRGEPKGGYKPSQQSGFTIADKFIPMREVSYYLKLVFVYFFLAVGLASRFVIVGCCLRCQEISRSRGEVR